MSTRKSEIITELKADTSNFSRGLAKAKTEAKDFKTVTDKLTGSFKGVFSGLGVSLGAAGITAGLVAAGRSAMNYVEEIRNAADATGLTTDQIQLLSGAAEATGTPLSAMQAHLVELNNLVNTEEGRAKLAGIGITAKDSAGAIEQLAKKMQNASQSDLANIYDVLGNKFAKLVSAYKEFESFDIAKDKYNSLGGDAFLNLEKANALFDKIARNAKKTSAEILSWTVDKLTGEDDPNDQRVKNSPLSPEFINQGKPISDLDFKGYINQNLPIIDTKISREDFIARQLEAFESTYITDYKNAILRIEQQIAFLNDGGVSQESIKFSKNAGTTAENTQPYIDFLKKRKNNLLDSNLSSAIFGDFEAELVKKWHEATAKEAKLANDRNDIINRILANADILANTSKDDTQKVESELKIKALNEQLVLEQDLLKNAELYAKLLLEQKNLQEIIAAQKEKEAQAAEKLIKEQGEQALKDFQFSDDLTELKKKESEALLGKGLLALPQVDNYRATGKMTGYDQDFKTAQDLQQQGNKLLEEIREEIKKLEFKNKWE